MVLAGLCYCGLSSACDVLFEFLLASVRFFGVSRMA